MIRRSFVVAALLCIVGFFSTPTTQVFAQYNWNPITSKSAKWLVEGTHTYKNNIGSLVIGDNFPSANLLLDVNGSMGAVGYCTGGGTNCFGAANYQWRRSGSHIYLSSVYNMSIGAPTTTNHVGVNGNINAISYLYNSDQRLKDAVRPARGLEAIGRLEGVQFRWREDGESTWGLVAQDVERVVPELVHTDPETGYKSVQYINMVALLIQALNEQSQEIEDLRIAIDSLR